jgi:creatinine amidohydrolase
MEHQRGRTIMRETSWARLKDDEVRALTAGTTVMILPIASIQQQEPNFPVMTDSRLGEEIARRAAKALARLITDPATWATPNDLRAAETGGVPLGRGDG